MNRSIIKNVIKILLIAIILFFSYNLISLATYSTIDVDYITQGAEENSGASDSVLSIIQSVLTIVQVIAVGVAIIMIIVLAIKYISSAPGDKADIKKSAIAYIVGAVILFSGAGDRKSVV